MRIAVLLSGSGVYDGSEIQEAVATLLALDKLGVEVVCTAPDIPQSHVIDHINGEEMEGPRNVLVESARIARGDIVPLSELSADHIDGMVMPGGFGAAKNLTSWAFEGPDSSIEPETKRLVMKLLEAKKPIASLCVSPVVVAKALQDSGIQSKLTLGTTEAASPYDIEGFNAGLAAVGVMPVPCALGDIVIDQEHRIVTSPCYMMEASISEIYDGIYKACEALVGLAKA